jgi:hypothetical protein
MFIQIYSIKMRHIEYYVVFLWDGGVNSKGLFDSEEFESIEIEKLKEYKCLRTIIY